MNIVIYGTGGVGGYFGARLAQAGNNVIFIARGKHLQAIKQKGLKVLSNKGNYLVQSSNAIEDYSEITIPIDVIFIAVKTWQLKEVAKKIKPFLQKETMVIPLLNGVENTEILLSELPKKNVLGGLCKIVSYIKSYGVIQHTTYEPTIVFGELSNEMTTRAKRLENILKQANITTKLSKNITIDVWTKFLYITTISAIGALTRATIGEMLENKEIVNIMHNTAKEIVAVAKAKGIFLANDCIEKQFKIIKAQPYITTSSSQRDIMEGKPSELESQNGAVVKLGKQLGIPTPTNSFIYYCLLPQEKRVREKVKS